MTEEYNLKKSQSLVGQLYPVILSKDGKVIDGFHRLEDDAKWRTETLEHIDTEEKMLIARPIANWHRRAVPRSEKEKWINDLAKFYQKQGYTTKGEPMTIDYKGTPYTSSNQILVKIMDVTGLSDQTVLRHLLEEYKQLSYPKRKIKPKIPASQRIESELGSDYVERHREEVREEIEEEVKAESIEKAKEELSEDPNFILEAIEKAPEILIPKRVPVVDRQGYHKPTVERTAQREARTKNIEVTEERENLRASPEMRDKSKLLKAWRALGMILASSKDLACPICGGTVEAVLKCPNCGEIPLSEAKRRVKDAVQ